MIEESVLGFKNVQKKIMNTPNLRQQGKYHLQVKEEVRREAENIYAQTEFR